MNLYKVSQNINNGYDTYDSVVVCAESEKEARLIHPSESVTHHKNGKWYGTYRGGERIGEEYEFEDECNYGSWVSLSDIDKLKVEYIGDADKKIKKGIIIASFNAG